MFYFFIIDKMLMKLRIFARNFIKFAGNFIKKRKNIKKYPSC